MTAQQKVEQFIAGKKTDIAGKQDMKHLLPGTLPFVTISSQSGAGGNRFAANLKELLANDDSGIDELKDWRVFDKSMCQHLLEQEHLSGSMSELLHENYHSQINEFVLGIFGDGGMQNVAYARLARQLRMLASVGKVIIVGHGGCMATRGLAGGTHIRLVAPMPVRTVRMATMLDLDEAQTTSIVRQRDSEHNRLLKTHYRVDDNDPELYHLACNTEWIPPYTAAEIVLSILRKQLA